MTIIGHYQLGDELGAGGMGTVHLGLDTQTEQPVAIKQLKDSITSADTIERFRREGEALRDLNHPNIVKMLDMFEHEGQHYLVMEYVSGGDLSDFIKQGDIPLEQITSLAIDLADALTRAHKLHIIHRDLKPANIMIGDDGVLRLTDFGVAHVGSKARVTDTDAIVGTIDYLPPEAFSGESFDARSDIWAFGVILFEILTGQRPFAGDTLFEVIQNITTSPIPDLEILNPTAPIALVDLVYRMLERDPQARIRSVRQIGLELEDLLQGRDKIVATKRFETDIPDFINLPKHNLPAQTTPFVGREHELDELDKLLKDPNLRLITILAQGGMGKTRLSLELAQRAIDANLYADGVYFVELAPLSSADNIPNAIGDACGFQFLGEGTPKEQLLSILKDRQTLLVLDNFEHLPDGFAIVTDILQSAPQIHIVATSRQQLSQIGETLFYLSGMDFPDFETPEDALDYAAVKLFMNSAKRAKPSFELVADNLDYVARICKLVQGMPLGIVLAASWLTLLDVSEIADEIQGSLDFLETDETALPERQRSIRAVMDYSWGQMTEAEQMVLMKLSVFRGGFTREASQAVAGASLRILMSLTKKSFLRRNADSGRYEIHELLRQYAGEELINIGISDITQQKHETYYLSYLATREDDLKGKRQLDALTEINSDFDNIHEAWIRAVDQGQVNEIVTVLNALVLYSDINGIYRVGAEHFDYALEQLTSFEHERLRSRLIFRSVFLQTYYNHSSVSFLEMLQTAEISIDSSDESELGFMHLAFGFYYSLVDRQLEVAIGHFNSGLDIYRKIGDKFYEGFCLLRLGFCLGQARIVETSAKEVTETSIQIAKEIGDMRGIVWGSANLGSGLLYTQPHQAINILQEAVAIQQQASARFNGGWPYCNLAICNAVFGNVGEAQKWVSIGLRVSRDIGQALGIADALETQAFLAMLSSNYTIGYQLLTQVNQLHAHPLLERRIQRDYAMYFCLIKKYDEAKLSIYKSLSQTDPSETIHILWLLACHTLILHFHKQYSDTVSIITCLEKSSGILGVNLKIWKPYSQLIENCTKLLGEEAYTQAWERGKTLDLETVVQELIEEFSDNETEE